MFSSSSSSSSSSSRTLSLTPSFHLKPHSSFPFTLSIFSYPKLSSLSLSLSKSFICNSLNPSNDDREDIRWLREEQRWLREEERWIREQQRWNRERESLLREIDELNHRILSLERRNSIQGGTVSVSETIANIAGLLQVLKENNMIADGGLTVSSLLLDDNNRRNEELEVEKKEIVEEVVKVFNKSKAEEEEVKIQRRSLRYGSEGVEVQALQEALLRLGFYCGEEDVEFSSFSSGTERAVKTWQAASGIPEDGIMTAELLEMLYTAKVAKNAESDEKTDQKGNISRDKRDGLNGAVSSITEISEIQQKVVKEGGANIEVSQQRVFLIGENRWEDPSRLHMPNGKAVDGKTKDTSTKCLACRGEGRLLCTECDGSGEPNIEPQFLEWIDEGTKCPYCGGLGYTTCDVCEGKTVS